MFVSWLSPYAEAITYNTFSSTYNATNVKYLNNTGEEILDGDNMYTCLKCNEKRKCTKKLSIFKYPRVLVRSFTSTTKYKMMIICECVCVC